MRSLLHGSVLLSVSVSSVSIMSAQTPHSDQLIASSVPASSPQEGAVEVSPKNPWFTGGFQVGYRLGGNSAFSDDLIASGRTTILLLKNPIKIGKLKWQLPIVGNIGKLSAALPSGSKELLNAATELLNTAEGISVEIAPYSQPRDIDSPGSGNLGVTYYFSAGYKLNAARSRLDSSTLYLGQVRFALGAEFSIRLRDADTKPLTLSLGGTSTWFLNKTTLQLATGREQKPVISWDVTLILPVSGFGLLSQAAIAPHTYTLWRVGVLVAKQN